MKARAAWLVIVILALGVLFAVGCQRNAGQPAQQAKTETQQSQATTEETEADTSAASTQAVDPVCGMTVSKDTEYTAEYDGQMYYFCSKECRDQFMADPEKYVPK
jgi:YHS domain-containing protein